MKGRITLQPLRKEKYTQEGWPVFDVENGWIGEIEYEEEHGVKIKDTDETVFAFENVKEFMVYLEDGSMVELNRGNIEEAMSNDWWDYYHNSKVLEFSVENGVASVVVEPVPLRSTERGFRIGEFKDQYGLDCSIQKSSIATKDCIWLGVTDVKPEIMVSDARRLGITESNANGWMPYEIPREVMLSSRMHLSREDVKKLLPLLQKFVDTGELD
jgi:hypothetical protein